MAEGGSVLLGQLHVGGDVLQGRCGLARLAIESTIYGKSSDLSFIFVLHRLLKKCKIVKLVLNSAK